MDPHSGLKADSSKHVPKVVRNINRPVLELWRVWKRLRVCLVGGGEPGESRDNLLLPGTPR